MVSRRHIVSRPPARVSVSRIVRSRGKRAATTDHMDGEVIDIDEPDLITEILRKCPVERSPFRKGPLHVSDVIGKCIRRIALSEHLAKPMPAAPVSDSMGLTFAQGTAIHDFVKQRFISGHPDMLYGKWACLCGNTITEPMVREEVPSRLCPDCGGEASRYVECDILDSELGMIGSPDVIFYMRHLRLYYPVELKSLAYDDWKEIVRPKPDHIVQILFYWYFMKRAGFNVPSQVSIIYVSKGYLFKSPYKEFVIQVGSYEDVEKRLACFLDDARALKAFREGGELPPRVVCSSMSAKDAKECHVCVACFAV